jgi:hypothetical protein
MGHWKASNRGKDFRMPWFNIRKQYTPGERPEDAGHEETQPTGERFLPPHMQRLVDARNEARQRDKLPVEQQRAALERKRLAIEFDIEQGELATDQENPWTHRIELLTEALATVEQDIRDVESVQPGQYHPLPQTPIGNITVTRDDGALAVSFTISDGRFAYGEVLDWAERGHQVAPPEFRVEESHVDALIPSDIPRDLSEPLRQHLVDSLAVFATDLRDRTLDDEPLPASPTLADLAGPCPACGGWTDWRGRCDACTRRKAEAQNLLQERNRLLRERSAESEERHRLAERLPIARKRLADLEREIEAFERTQGAPG